MDDTGGGGIGPLLRRHRIRAGLTQEELAEAAAMSARAISDIERGLRARPYPETLRLLAAALALTDAERTTLIAAARPKAAPITLPRSTAVASPLPHPATALVGRERELAALVTMLGTGGTRLVTLTGPGGAGKTRLAQEAGLAIAGQFADGVAFVDLAPLAEASLVPAAVGAAMGIQATEDRPIAEAVLNRVAGGNWLLLLDNLEHLLDAAPFVAALLAAGPGVRVLATSRAPLRVRPEREFPLGPLALPPLGSVDEQTGGPAVRLFLDRMRAVRPDVALDREAMAAVGQLCRRLDGLPLAIELAAARTRALPPVALLARMGKRLPVLVGGARDLPARQQTMRAAIAWSHDLLDPAEQTLFRRLAAFPAGCTLAAASSVASPDELARGDQVSDDLGALERLVEHSLLRLDRDPNGEPRFRMLETVREFAAELLTASGEAEAVNRRRATRLLTLVQTAESDMRDGRLLAGWLDHLDAEHDNLRAVLAWAVPHDGETGLRLAGALTPFWTFRGHLSEGRQWFERLFQATPRGDVGVRAKALQSAGKLAWNQGDLATAEELQTRSLALWREIGDTAGEALSLTFLADVIGDRGDGEQAVAFYGDALALYQTRGDAVRASWVANNLGVELQVQGKWGEAATLYADALAMARAVDDRGTVVVSLGNLADVAMAEGRVTDAAALFQESLAVAAEIDDRASCLQGLVGIARAAAEQGDGIRAVRLLGAAEAHGESIGVPFQAAEQDGHARAVALGATLLGEPKFTNLWRQGRSLPLQDAISEALGETTPNA